MTETHNDDRYTKPSQPVSPVKHAVVNAGFGVAAGAVIETAWQGIVNWASKNKQSLNKNKIVEMALGVGVLSAVIGYFTAHSDAKAHKLSVENSNLKNRIEHLQSQPVYSDTKNTIKSVVQDSSVWEALANTPNPTAEDIQNIAHEAVQRSSAMQELKEEVEHLAPETKQGLRNYMEALKKEVSRIEPKPQDASWEESIKPAEGQSLAQR